jgi:hypothetical protein
MQDFPLLKTLSFGNSTWNYNVDMSLTARLYYGVWAQNLPWPDWTFGNATFEPFRPSAMVGDLSATSYSGTTTGFFPRMDCEEATIDDNVRYNSTNSNKYVYRVDTTIRSPSCTVEIMLDWLYLTGKHASNSINENADRSFMGTSRNVNCSDQTQRYLFVVTLVDRNLTLLGSRSVNIPK